MDWPCSLAYCRAVAAAFGIRLLVQYRDGGFEREMLRDDTPTAPVWFETQDGGRARPAAPAGRGAPA
jgi:hypothetical protein